METTEIDSQQVNNNKNNNNSNGNGNKIRIGAKRQVKPFIYKKLINVN